MPYLDYLENITYLNNTLLDYAYAVVGFVLSMVVLKVFQMVVLSRLKKLAEKTKTDLDDVFVGLVSSVKPPLYFFISVYIGYQFLDFDDRIDNIVGMIIFVLIVYEIIRSLAGLFDYFIEKQAKRQKTEGERKQTKTVLGVLKTFVMIGLWIVAVILILSNYGVNVSSIIASLGIGGLAVALALQNILTDIFSSFSIFVDKPFQIGDFIIVGEHSGNVQQIGLKTTRIKTLEGQELVISNKELTSARVENYGRMKRRRVVVTLGVEYGTSKKVLESIPDLTKRIVDNVEKATFDRCHFKTYGPYSLDFELVYYVESADYVDYMDINQAINMDIYEVFTKENINFAFPTQTVFVQK